LGFDAAKPDSQVPEVSSFQAHKRIGQNIRNFRQSRGMTQEVLAEKANLNPVCISQVERAERAVTIDDS
jgi:ribosome-binding protein aMBF1 (putative translation factor)